MIRTHIHGFTTPSGAGATIPSDGIALLVLEVLGEIHSPTNIQGAQRRCNVHQPTLQQLIDQWINHGGLSALQARIRKEEAL